MKKQNLEITINWIGFFFLIAELLFVFNVEKQMYIKKMYILACIINGLFDQWVAFL